MYFQNIYILLNVSYSHMKRSFNPVRFHYPIYLFSPALVLFIIIFSGGVCNGQPVNWQPPISGQILLSGTYGELRGNHYHGGTDIKPNVPGPQEVLATSDGYVKEIMVRGGSYGRALLLQHKDGYQSLYGHLDHFIPALDSMIYAYQYDQKNFEVNLHLDSTQFPVTAGMIIATMGNTGYSFGRHLHFEVRHPSGTTYNPLLAIPNLQDNTPPRFRNLKINYHDDQGREYQEKVIPVRSLGAGKYSAGDLVLNSFKYSLAVDVIDLHKNTPNQNGIYSLEMYRDSSLVYRSVMDSLSTEDRKYYPEHIDHISSPGSQAIYHNLRYSSKGIRSQLDDPNRGLIRPYPFQTQNYTIIASDYQGNQSTLTFSIRRVEHPSIDYTVVYNYLINSSQSSRVELGQSSIVFPGGTFVRDQRLYLFEEKIVRDNEEIIVVHMTENQTPLYERPLLKIRSDIPLREKSKWTIARCAGEKYSAIPTTREKDYFSSRIGQLSSYCLILDTLPPEIKFHPQNSNLWHFTITDNLHSFSSLKYSATVDGNWTLVEADDKNNKLIFRDFKKYRDGNDHHFVLEVKDACGNTTIFDREFK